MLFEWQAVAVAMAEVKVSEVVKLHSWFLPFSLLDELVTEVHNSTNWTINFQHYHIHDRSLSLPCPSIFLSFYTLPNVSLSLLLNVFLLYILPTYLHTYTYIHIYNYRHIYTYQHIYTYLRIYTYLHIYT